MSGRQFRLSFSQSGLKNASIPGSICITLARARQPRMVELINYQQSFKKAIMIKPLLNQFFCPYWGIWVSFFFCKFICIDMYLAFDSVHKRAKKNSTNISLIQPSRQFVLHQAIIPTFKFKAKFYVRICERYLIRYPVYKTFF